MLLARAGLRGHRVLSPSLLRSCWSRSVIHSWRLPQTRLLHHQHHDRSISHIAASTRRPLRLRLLRLLVISSLSLAVVYVLALTVPPVRHLTLGVTRCTRVAIAVGGCIVDYKLLFRKTWDDSAQGRQQRHDDYEITHYTAARRILHVLRLNGGIYVKLGQHLSSIQLIPQPWSETMKPLQDQCNPTPMHELQHLIWEETGVSDVRDLFETFDQVPIGVASLAQVHRATEKGTQKPLAVKIMHAGLEEFCQVDTQTVMVMLKLVKWVFPTFEFTWLGEEMKENLPKEMDFRHEASNAFKCRESFAKVRVTDLKIPEVLWCTKRVLVMEYIDGARIDDLEYLSKHKIDRNKLSQSIAQIFSRMVYLNGYFHADPHGGNLLVRPASPHDSTFRGQYNYEVVLLDHGLYFDLDHDLRTNYARLWLSLLQPSSPKVQDQRRHYAKLVGNISNDQYSIFESAITGRAGLDGTWNDEDAKSFDSEHGNGNRGGSLMEMGRQNKDEMKKIRERVVESGIITDVFKILRTVPRRLLMILKVNDLTRSLDQSLNTTHSPNRIWLIVARCCGLSVWKDDCQTFKTEQQTLGWSFNLARRWVLAWIDYQRWYNGLRVVEWGVDAMATWSKFEIWIRALGTHGWSAAWRQSAGLQLHV